MVWTAQIVWILLLWTSLLPSSKGLKRGRKSTTNLQTIAEQKLTASLASHYSDVMYIPLQSKAFTSAVCCGV